MKYLLSTFSVKMVDSVATIHISRIDEPTPTEIIQCVTGITNRTLARALGVRWTNAHIRMQSGDSAILALLEGSSPRDLFTPSYNPESKFVYYKIEVL